MIPRLLPKSLAQPPLSAPCLSNVILDPIIVIPSEARNLSLPSVILDIFNRGSSVFVFVAARSYRAIF